MNIKDNIGWAYGFFQTRRPLLLLCVGVFLCLCLITLSSKTITTDIRSMLPGGEDGSIAEDFTLLNSTALSNKLFITLHAGAKTPPERLAKEADALIKALPEPFFHFKATAKSSPPKVLDFLIKNIHNLVTEQDFETIQNSLGKEAIQNQLEKNVKILTSPQGILAKDAIRHDPLDYRSILTQRLLQYSSMVKASFAHGHIFNEKKDSLLITATTPIAMTNAEKSQELMAAFKKACTQALTPGISAEIVGSHPHTVANASVIKRDLRIISVVSLGAFAFLFFFYFRSFGAVGIIAAPFVSLCAALGITSLFFEQISAVVIGFGAVLLGISIDFAMHVYYATISNPLNRKAAILSVSTPILFGLGTSCAAFGALFLSDIPNIRQLSFFSIAGLLVAALYALFVLPHFCAKAKAPAQNPPVTGSKRKKQSAQLAAAILLFIGLAFSIQTRLDTNLLSMGYVSKEIQRAEQNFNDSWGAVRNKALLFTNAPTLKAAIECNEKLWNTLQTNFPQAEQRSFAPFLPTAATQVKNRTRWKDFWQEDQRQEKLAQLLVEEGKQYHFAAQAFQPFIKSLNGSAKADVTLKELEQGGLGMLKELFGPHQVKGHEQFITFVPDTEEIRAHFDPLHEKQLMVRLISHSRLKEKLEATMQNDIIQFILASGAAVLLLAFLLFRNTRRAVISLIPSVLGVLTVFSVLAATSTPLTLYHIIALPLVIGLGADYGIFMVCQEREEIALATIPAIRLSGLTTLAGFGVLALGRHPSLHSLGITVLLGVGAALASALYLLPHYLRRGSQCA